MLNDKGGVMKDFYAGKKVLITGAAGTVGQELARQMSLFEPAELHLIDINESDIFFLSVKYNSNKNIFCFLADIRDRLKVQTVLSNIDIVIDCAALKHVILSENNPFEAVRTNIIGVENLIQAAKTSRVNHFLYTSTDKAVNPTSVMGTTKLLGEKLITAANIRSNGSRTVFSNTRFGNVLGSRGSVVPLFMRQLKKGGPVTITDKGMTRFIMSIADSAKLVLQSMTMAKGGEVFVTKMPVVKIPDLAEVMIELLAPRYGYDPDDIKIIEIGAKVGEKMFEELLSEEEVPRSLELPDMFVILPPFKSMYESIHYDYPDLVTNNPKRSYVSSNETPLTKSEIKKYLIDNDVFNYVEESNGGVI